MTIDLKEDLIVFIGDNGSGKTGILDAIAYQLMHFRNEITNKKMFTFPVELDQKRLKNYDVNNESEELINTASFTIEFPNGDKHHVTPIIRATKNKEAIVESWKAAEELNVFNAYTLGIYYDKLEQKLSNIPVLIYYGGGSINTEIEDNDNDIELIQMDIFDTYRQSLEAKEFNFTQLMLLLDRQQKIKLQQPNKRNFITFLDEALTTMLSDDNGYTYQNLRMEWGDTFDEMIMDKVGKDGHIQKLVINQLSSGERNLLALVSDLTRRLFLANPIDNPLHGNGIVLIDEIDVHLHPKWQRKVVTKLREVFPNVQFVVTTHSPLVIQNCLPQSLRKLLSNGTIITPQVEKGSSLDAIFDDIFDIEGDYDIETEGELEKFYEFKDKILEGKIEINDEKFIDTVKKLSLKSVEVRAIIGSELRQIKRLINQKEYV